MIDNREYKFGGVDLHVRLPPTYVVSVTYAFSSRTMNVTRRRYIDVRDSLTCVFYRRTSSCRAYVFA